MTIYYITDNHDAGAQPRLVEAASNAQAHRHVSRNRFACKAAKPADVAHAMGLGAKVEKASEEPDAFGQFVADAGLSEAPQS